MCWQKRRRGIVRPRMLLRSKERRNSSPRIRGGRLRVKGSHSRSGRNHPSPSQLLLSLFLLLLQLMLPTRKRQRPRQTNTQRQRKRPILLSILLRPPEIALRFSVKLTQHRSVTIMMMVPRRKTLHLSLVASLFASVSDSVTHTVGSRAKGGCSEQGERTPRRNVHSLPTPLGKVCT